MEPRRHIPGDPFHLDRKRVYKRVKFVLKMAGIKIASTHTLRKTAGACFFMATRDIFAASRFLGHFGVKVTESHYIGLIQSLQSRYALEFDRTLTGNLGK